jgi:hypothetical protein
VRCFVSYYMNIPHASHANKMLLQPRNATNQFGGYNSLIGLVRFLLLALRHVVVPIRKDDVKKSKSLKEDWIRRRLEPVGN